MWKRLPDSVIAEARRVHLLQQRAWPRRFKLTAMWTLIGMVLFALGFRGGSPRTGIFLMSSVQTGSIVPLILISPFCFMLVLPLVILATWHDRKYSLACGAVCGSCGGSCGPTHETHCACGHVLEPVAHFEWVDSDPGQPEGGPTGRSTECRPR